MGKFDLGDLTNLLDVESVNKNYPHFKFITNKDSFPFGMNLIERVMANDEDVIRYDQFRVSGYIIDSKNCIGSNIHMQSIL